LANTHLAAVIYQGFWTALDWIYPPECAGCGEPGYRLCVNCLESIEFISGRICRICGLPLTGKGEICSTCRETPPPYTALRSLTRYQGVIRECIHDLKYRNNQSLGEFFSSRMVDVILEEEWEADLVVPVPLSPDRQTDRGYNQSALLARPIALKLGWRYCPVCLERTRITKSQVSLTVEERKQNVAGAFTAVTELVAGKRVLLIDDVTTTGSTLFECTRALKRAGANVVYCMTLSRPIHSEVNKILNID
jgi:ComF family protein